MPVKARNIHIQSLETSTALSAYYIPKFIPPLEVFRVLNAAKVRFMLVGTHALGGWTRRPRTTTDIDILVGTRLHKKAVRVLLTAFPQLHSEEQEDETHLRDADTGQVLIDVMKENQPLYRAALRNKHPVKWKDQTYWIPSLELALAMKFTAMFSATRGSADKHCDAGDFVGMIQSNLAIDSRKLHALGQFVYNGGGGEIVEMVRKVRAGEKLTL
ncbi:MAG TPA: hypothetical protein VMG10_22755 [Gemmataceae bacterium]|nr:hypothetical protein [Gemmataceae bacterium]